MSDADFRILRATAPGSIASYTWRGNDYTWTKMADGRWRGRYTLPSGALCSSGILDSRALASFLAHQDGVRFN